MPDKSSMNFPFSRRNFMAGALAVSGFALAAQPVAASAIVTDAEGLVAGPVSIAAGDATMPGYRARPAGAGPFPTILVVQEIFGVHEHIRDVCRRLAKRGYQAVAPELYFRQGNPAAIPDIETLLSTIVAKVPDRQVLSDLDATAAWIAADGQLAPGKLGITGFCWGGRITWLYAAHNPSLRAAVAWYGPLAGAPSELKPRYPIDVVSELKAPVLGLYGAADASIPLASIERMQAALANAPKHCEIVIYPDTPHAFFADYRPNYREQAAADGWRRMLDWFKTNGM